MKKIYIIALLACLFSFKANAQQDNSNYYTTNYGNGVYYIEADLMGQLPQVGARLAQFKQSHPEYTIISITSINGRYGTIGILVNCEKKNVSK